MSYNAKNYTEQGGEVTHIGGKLIIEEGAEVEGLPVAENQAESEASTVALLKNDFNGLLTKLKAAGIMFPDAPVNDDEEDDENIDGDGSGTGEGA